MSAHTAGGTSHDLSTRVISAGESPMLASMLPQGAPALSMKPAGYPRPVEPPMFIPTHEPVIDADTIRHLATRAVEWGLADPDARPLLFFGAGVRPDDIPRHQHPRRQTFQDLIVLSSRPGALLAWIANALVVLAEVPARYELERMRRHLAGEDERAVPPVVRALPPPDVERPP